MTMEAEYVSHMGDDNSVVNAARVSLDKDASAFTTEDNARLIRYLARNNHWSPFSHTAITLRMSAPVPIRTQCMKHAVGMNINEESRRYISSRPEIFVPDEFRAAPEGSVKQGSGGKHPHSDIVRREYVQLADICVTQYEKWILDGTAPEQARFILPQGCIVNWIWTGNLASFSRFYKERTYDKAQKEAQDLAHMVADIIKPLYPVSWAALTEVKE